MRVATTSRRFRVTALLPLIAVLPFLLASAVPALAQGEAHHGFVQFIHNAPDPDAEAVDLFIDGRLVTEVGEEGSIEFRRATPYLAVEISADDPQATREVEIQVVATHIDPEHLPRVLTSTLTLGAGERHVVVFVGADPDDYALLVHQNLRFGDVAEGRVAASFLHGSPDLPPVDLRENGQMLFENIYYKEFADHVDVEAGPRTVEVWLAGEPEEPMFARFEVDDFETHIGETVTLLISGFSDVTMEPEPVEPDFALLAVFEDGTRRIYEAHGVSAEPGTEPASFSVGAAYPNPFASTTTLSFTLPEASVVRAEVFDVLGRRVLATEAGVVPAGAGHAVELDGAALAAGAYLWRLTAEGRSGTYTESGRVTVAR